LFRKNPAGTPKKSRVKTVFPASIAATTAAGYVAAGITADTIRDRLKYPCVAKAGGLQSLGVKGEIVVGYLDPLTTQDLKSSGFPEG